MSDRTPSAAQTRVELQAENKRLREALWQIAEATPSSEDAGTLAKAFMLVRGYAREALDRG